MIIDPPKWIFATRDTEEWLRAKTAVRLRCLTKKQAVWLFERVWLGDTFKNRDDVLYIHDVYINNDLHI